MSRRRVGPAQQPRAARDLRCASPAWLLLREARKLNRDQRRRAPVAARQFADQYAAAHPPKRRLLLVELGKIGLMQYTAAAARSSGAEALAWAEALRSTQRRIMRYGRPHINLARLALAERATYRRRLGERRDGGRPRSRRRTKAA